MGKVNRNKAQLIVFCCLTVLWMGVIFWFSAANSSESSDLSGTLLRNLLSKLIPHWKTLTAGEKRHIFDSLHTLFRKLGHFSEYAVLGALFFAAVHLFLIQSSRLTLPKAEIWLPALLSSLYAVSDEFHQKYVAGRSCELRDMLIDTAGACFGIALMLAVRALHRYRKRKKSKHTVDITDT